MNIGDKAPEVLGINEKGVEIRLSDYKGKKIVLYFYPKDMTSGCTAQACNLRDNYADLRKAGYEVIGVSVDSEKSHQKFIEKNNLPFTLIADTDKKLKNRDWLGELKHSQELALKGLENVAKLKDNKYLKEQMDTDTWKRFEKSMEALEERLEKME